MQYQRDPKGLKPLLRSIPLRNVVYLAARRGLRYVTARADRDTGAFARGLRLRVGTSTRDGRVLVRLEASDPKSAAIEFGNRRTKARHLLRSAIPIIEGKT